MRLVQQRPLRILHVVGSMRRAGTETWLMQVLRHIDRERFQMDFLVSTDQPCAYDEEIRSLGSKVIPCLHPSKPWLFAHNFKQILYEYGPYDIIHSHVHHYSGHVLRLAKQVGIPIRIAHSHLDTSPLTATAKLPRRLYIALMKQWIARHATLGFSASNKAAIDLFGLNWKTDPRWQILFCGVNLTPFQALTDSIAVRAEFGIPTDAIVVGHVGRFEIQKNHHFILEIITELVKQEPKIFFLLVGDGPLRAEIEQQVAQLGLTKRVIFTGSRSDVPCLMLGAMDVFLFPSFYEGLGLVLVEAQAAGLPCIFSDVIPEEADVVKVLTHRLSLEQSAAAWADAVISVKLNIQATSQSDALAIVEKSCFNIYKSLEKLEYYYVEHLNQSL